MNPLALRHLRIAMWCRAIGRNDMMRAAIKLAVKAVRS